MNKRILSKLLIFLIAAVPTVGISYGYAEAEQSAETAVQPAVAVKCLTPYLEASVDAMNGTHPELNSIFSVQTNGGVENNNFIITSGILTSDGEVSAYCPDGSILFAHIDAKPSSEDVANAKSHSGRNRNVIAYPTTATVKNQNNPIFVSGDSNKYGYLVDIGSAQEAEVIHTVGSSPVSGTYDLGMDQAGKYQAVLYFSVVNK